ncbi:MAG: hypothetical protein JNJ77_20325 [Planctomycetia bacterium]|nr:hypothetical protein [Planctomycetia bacterium]
METVTIMPEVLGIDIGGANLKAANTRGEAVILPFPLWKQPDKLAGGLMELLVRLPHKGPVAITMTGELCDCFESRSTGVRHILKAAVEAFKNQPVFVWRNDARWASTSHAHDDPMPVASANWLASATYCARYLPHDSGWFFDLGSTTLDMIPVDQGKVVSTSRTDLDRLYAGELAYLGASRTPVCHLLQQADLEEKTITLAAEFFATLDDAMIILGYSPEQQDDRQTADGKPRTRAYALARMARMACSDLDELGEANVQLLSEQVIAAFREKLSGQLQRAQLSSHPWGGIILAGSGEGILAEEVAMLDDTTNPVVSMTGRLGPDVSSALAAYSVAVLLSERQSK